MPPGQMPNVPPPTPMLDHSFTLQAIMDLTKSVGELTAKTDRLIGDVKGQSDKLDEVRHKITFVRGAVWVIGGFLLLLGGILTAYIRNNAPAVAVYQPPSASPAPTPAPTPPLSPRRQ